MGSIIQKGISVCLSVYLLAILLAPFAFAQKTQDKSDMAAADFPALVSDYLQDLHSRHPSLATASGIHAWDGQLEDYSAEALSAEASTIRRFQDRLEKIPPLSLKLSDLFDYQIISNNMRSRLLELEEVKSYQSNPQVYSEVISSGLLQVAMFEHVNAESRLRHIISKQKQIPRLLGSARDNVRLVPAIFVKVSVSSFKGLLSFIQNDLPKAFASVKDAKLQADFKKSTRTAASAVSGYIKYLEKIKPDPAASFALGKEKYQAKIKYDEGIDIPLETLLKIALRELEATQEQFRKTANQVDPARSPQAVWADVQRDHPRAGALVAEAQKQLDALVRFIEEKQIVTLPEGPAPVVAPTPDFMRWSTASMWTPGPYETRQLPGRYLITDVDPSWTEKEKQEYLASFNYPQLWSTSIHEAYPGHFVQGAYLKKVESNVRKTWALAPASFVEGWAHYTEQMMIEEGFGNGDPKIKLGQLADALLRLCRFVVGIKLHTEGATVEQATKYFMDNAYMGETPARLEAERGTFDPTYLVYSVGKLAILKLRDDYRREHKEDFSLRDFHDRLLSIGMAPLWVHRQMLLPGEKGKLIE